MSAYSIERLNSFTTSEAPKNCKLFVVPLFGDDGRNRHAHRFLSGIAEKALSPPVPTGDFASEVGAHNSVVAGLNDGGELPCSLLTIS
jgi:hypothetical protein